jgi:hypothetical protein
LGNLKERDLLGDLDASRRIVIKWIFKGVGWGGRNWIHLASDSDRW